MHASDFEWLQVMANATALTLGLFEIPPRLVRLGRWYWGLDSRWKLLIFNAVAAAAIVALDGVKNP